jgi:hypothetical protein
MASNLGMFQVYPQKTKLHIAVLAAHNVFLYKKCTKNPKRDAIMLLRESLSWASEAAAEKHLPRFFRRVFQ